MTYDDRITGHQGALPTPKTLFSSVAIAATERTGLAPTRLLFLVFLLVITTGRFFAPVSTLVGVLAPRLDDAVTSVGCNRTRSWVLSASANMSEWRHGMSTARYVP